MGIDICEQTLAPKPFSSRVHAGMFRCIKSHKLRKLPNQIHNDRDFQPLFGGDRLRTAARHQRGYTLFYPISFNKGLKVVPYSLLERTVPGRLLIWQADHPMLDIDFRTRLFVAGKLFNAAVFGVSRIILHKLVLLSCFFLQGALRVCI
ncbi:hypothetical protein BO71DRAFT_239878 [Aspergillus ellipticus CBS 707.79]|uniref:Uncharacterized protein n=1 Tax=Aspergillus ellipticus CBS 707.79 TaxID=1448320 RepID=A0A319D9Q5_9EURO|nr:hypothetical protein BO71DRAFT_239878 [Aspergillus ellipticus CBS 707.79]